MRKVIYFGLFAVVYCLLDQGLASACPGCNDLTKFGKDAAQTMRFGKGVAWSMAMMFAVPALLIGTAAAAIVYRARKAAKMPQNESV